jgi:hypothetical protein
MSTSDGARRACLALLRFAVDARPMFMQCLAPRRRSAATSHSESRSVIVVCGDFGCVDSTLMAN